MKQIWGWKYIKPILLVGVVVAILSSPGIALAAAPTPTPPAPENPGQAVLNPLGIGLATLFAFLMIILFRWMFKVPPQLPYHVVKARQSVSALQKILVPARAENHSERAVELACRLGESQKAEIVLVYVIDVPYTLSLDTSMPAEEAKGREALLTARFIVEQHGLAVKTKIIHHRNTWGGILSVASQELVDAIVMNGEHRGSPESLSSVAQEVVKRAECEVILDRAPYRSLALGTNGTR